MSRPERASADFSGASRPALRLWPRWAAALLSCAPVLFFGGGSFTDSDLGPVFHVAGLVSRMLALAFLALGFGVVIGALAVDETGGKPRFLFARVAAARERAKGRQPVRESEARVPRTVWSVSVAVLILVALVIGIQHATVWNPMAKVPELSLDEIYAGLAANNGKDAGVPLLAGWAYSFTLAALAFPFLCHVARLTPRVTAVLGLMIFGATILAGGFAGARMSVSIADTFPTHGGDAAVTGPILFFAGQAAIMACLIMAIIPAASGERRQVVTVNDAVQDD